MKKNRFFNLLLVTSFLLSNLGMTPTNQTGLASSNISANIDGMFEGIGSWLDGMRVVSFETGTTPVDILTPTPTPGLGIAPTTTPTPTSEPGLRPTLAPTEIITPTQTPTPDPELLLAALEVTLQPDPAAPGDVVTATWTIQNYQGGWEGVEIWLYLPEAFVPLEFGDGTYDPETNLLILPIREDSGLFS